MHYTENSPGMQKKHSRNQRILADITGQDSDEKMEPGFREPALKRLSVLERRKAD